MLFVFIFRASRERGQKLPPPPHNLTVLKGSVKIAANRDFVDFALNNHKAKDLLEWAKEAAHPDECFFAMLNHNPSLRVRGAYLGKKDKMSGKRHFIKKKKKKRPMHFSVHFNKSTLFSDIAKYVYYVTDSRLPDALICF